MTLAITGPGRWSAGVLVGLPIWGIVTVLALLAGIALIIWRLTDDSAEGAGLLGTGFIGIAVLSAVGMFFGFYPLSAQYHQWRNTAGQVQTIDSRLIGQDKSTSTKYVVTFADDPTAQYGCNDTRCAGVHVGDQLTLTCKRVNQWFGTDGWDCNFVSYEPTGALR